MNDKIPEEFAAFGECEQLSLSRVQRIGGARLAENWAKIPHVTHNDEVDITRLEALRVRALRDSPKIKITLLAFCVRAVVELLKRLPVFNASLTEDGSALIVKKYYNIGIATDTPRGLMVPVVRDCDKKSIVEIAAQIADLSGRAREKGLPLADMAGGSFSISSLGRDGGLSFTPIIHAPQVAILGISRQVVRPMRDADGALAWGTMLPLSLSYDHRVINGADAARFMTGLRKMIEEADPSLWQIEAA